MIAFRAMNDKGRKHSPLRFVFLAPYSIDSVVIPLTTRLETDDYTQISEGTRLNNEDYIHHMLMERGV